MDVFFRTLCIIQCERRAFSVPAKFFRRMNFFFSVSRFQCLSIAFIMVMMTPFANRYLSSQILYFIKVNGTQTQPIYIYIQMLHQSDINLISFSLKCSLSLLLFYLNIGHTFASVRNVKTVVVQTKPIFIKYFILYAISSAQRDSRKTAEHFFVFLLSMNAFTVALDRHFHFHFEIFCFAFFFAAALSHHFTLIFVLYCVILKSTTNKELLLIHAKSLCVYKSVMRTKVNT